MQNIGAFANIVKCWFIGYGWELAKAALILILGIWLTNKICKVIAVVLGQTSLDVGLISFFSSAFRLFLRAILVLVILAALGVNVSSIITALGASIVTIGILLKDGVSNFVSGLLLIVNKPIRVGDYIEFENVKGYVTKIEMAFTTLSSPEGKAVIIPNFRLYSNNIIRQSPYNICKCKFFLEVSNLKTKIDVKKTLEGLLLSNENILKIPVPKAEYVSIEGDIMKLKVSIFCEKRFVSGLDSEIEQGIKNIFTKLKASASIKKFEVEKEME